MSTRDGNSAWPHRPLRFVWRSDAEGRFTVDSDEFLALMGPDRAAALGRPWPEIAATLALDLDGQVALALVGRATWSGLQVDWPVGDGTERVAVELSGLPVFDRDRVFRGQRGFGICRGPTHGAGARALGSRAATVETRADTKPAPRLRARLDAHPPAAIGEAVPAAISLRPGAAPSLIAHAAENVVQLRPGSEVPALTPGERNAFHELTRQLTERLTRARADAEPRPVAAAAAAAGASAPIRLIERSGEEIAAAIEQPAPSRDPDRADPPQAALAPAPAQIDELRSALAAATYARRRAEQANAVKSELLVRTMREMRGALAAIIGTPDADGVRIAAEHLRSLVDDLDHLAKVAAGERRPDSTQVALNPLVQRCVAILQPQASRTRVIIRSSLAPMLPPVAAEARSLKAMLLDLLAHCLESGVDGQLIVSTAPEDRGAVVLRLRGGRAAGDGRAAGAGNRAGDAPTMDLALARVLAEANGAVLSVARTRDAGTLIEVTFRTQRP